MSTAGSHDPTLRYTPGALEDLTLSSVCSAVDSERPAQAGAIAVHGEVSVE